MKRTMNPTQSSDRRGVYRRDQLTRLFAPASVAVVGASQSPQPFGSRVIAKLDEAGFRGQIFPVNPRYDTASGRICYPSISELPSVPDCIVIAVPRDAVEVAVEQAAALGVGGAVIFSSGYSETGKPERIAQQDRLAAIARGSGLRILGPNCLGVLNYNIGFQATFGLSPFSKGPGPRAIGLISQSGGLGFSLAQALEHGISFSHVLTLGNACDVDVADQISYLADDPSCHAIACVFEGTPNPWRLIEAADVARRAGKPVVVYKMATGALGAAAAMSHTGSLAGADATYRAAFARAGVVVVDNFEALIETTAFFAKAGRPKAPGVAVLATSGGACVMLADKAEDHAVPLPQPGDAARDVLERVIPEYGSAGNPCDVTGQVQASPEALFSCVDALLGDPAYSALVIPQPHASELTRARLQVFSEAARHHDKLVVSVWLSEWLEGPGATDTELDPHVALFRSSDRCFAALAAWNRREEWERAQSRERPRTSPEQAAPRVAQMLTSSGEAVLTERQAKKVLAEYGLPVVQEQLVQSVDEAVRAAAEIGFPVAIKVESPELPHKTEAGVVKLGICDKADLDAAYAAVMANARKVSPPPRIHGVLVQPMIAPGLEIMVGARVDPLFGPVIVVSLGGIMVELLKDTVIDLAPVAPWQAKAMLTRLKGSALLRGFRGSEAVDLDRLADIVSRLSEFIADQREHVAELDVNPLICSGGRILAVDALIVKATR
jgi:acyl-CoA synthetase (NDP forming)